jgi:hypothetical protein
MSRAMWFVVLAAVGVVAIVVIGVVSNDDGESQADARQSFCSSLTALKGSVDDLAGLSPASASKSDYQSAVDEIQGDWDQVTSDASDLKDVTMSQLDDAWDSFESAVEDVPDDASVSDALDAVKSSAQSLASTVQATVTGPDCS